MHIHLDVPKNVGINVGKRCSTYSKTFISYFSL